MLCANHFSRRNHSLRILEKVIQCPQHRGVVCSFLSGVSAITTITMWCPDIALTLWPRWPWCATLSTLVTRPSLASPRSVLEPFLAQGAPRDSPGQWESQGRVWRCTDSVQTVYRQADVSCVINVILIVDSFTCLLCNANVLSGKSTCSIYFKAMRQTVVTKPEFECQRWGK